MARSSLSGEILHFTGTRIRITGSGNLKQTLYSLNNVKHVNLLPLVMINKTDIEPLSLSNFTQQRSSLRVYTTEIGEVFNISKITVFVRPVATGYPQ